MENIKNNNINTMNKNNNDTMNKNNNSNSMNEITTTKKCPSAQGETYQPGLQLYKSAACNLREYHGVLSITAESLEKIMELLQLRPARLVAQGLASRKLLKSEDAMPDSCLDSSSDSTNSDVEMDEKAIASDISDSSGTISSSTDNSGSDVDDNESKHDLEAEDRKRPVHTALAAAGIKLRPRETRPLLLALGVRPHRLVKLGLVDREALLRSRRAILGRAFGRVRGQRRQQQHGPPGRRAHRGGGEGVGRPQYAPHPHPHPRDNAHGRSPARRWLARSSSPIHGLHGPHRPTHGPHGPHGPPRGPFQRAGRHGHQHQEHMQPFNDVPHGPLRHLGRPNHANTPPPGARMHPHRGSFHRHSGESDGEEVHRGSPGGGREPSHGRGCGKRGPPRHHRRPDHGRPHHAHGPHPGAGMHPRHEPAYYHSGESDGEEGAVMRRGSPGRGRDPSRGRGDGPPCHHGGRPNHGRPNHGRRPHGGERHRNHEHGFHHQGHHHGEDMHSGWSEGDDYAGMRRGPRHHGGPSHHGEGQGHRGRHNKRRLTDAGEDGIGKMPDGPPRWPSGGAGRCHHGSAGRHDRHQPPPPPPSSPMVVAH